jgi:tetratricopeptide (TPR) repeat protein
LGNTLRELGRLDEAKASYTQAIALKPDYAEAYCNLGITLQELGRLDEAKASFNQAIALKPDFAEAHYNLGNTLKELGRLDDAEASFNQAIALKPDYAEAHSNLGNTLKELGRLDEAEASYTQAIALKPDYDEAHSNLGSTLQELGRLEEALASYNQAIALKPDYAEAHYNLGNTLQERGRLEEAEASYKQAIALKPDFALSHSGLGKVLYIKGNEDLALKSMVKANEIEPQSKEYKLMLRVMELRKSRKGNDAVVVDASNISALSALISSPLILNRVVEAELIASLYEMDSINLDKTKRVGLLATGNNDARYGNGIASPDFNLFEDAPSIIQKLAEDLTRIMIDAVKSDIFIYDSFFNILSAGGGTIPHKHINNLDKNIALNLAKQKYSLVYYLSVGDQNCSEPGMLKLYEPSEDILPCEGMITIIPASRMHSATYGGKTDRVMIGVNFYSL